MTTPDRDPRGRKVSNAARASNWWVVLVADAALGLAVILAGAVIAALWTPWAGVPVMAVGALYVVFVARRFLQWRWLRRQGGDS